MISRRAAVSCLGSLPLLHLAIESAYAHKEKYSLSRVAWAEGSSLLSVTHIFHLHDAEQALATNGIIGKPDLTSLQARAKMAIYTSELFRLYDDNSQIELTIVGAEIERGRCYVYQEGTLAVFPDILKVECSMLRDIVPGQINNVDIRKNGKTSSLKFSGNDGAKILLA